MTRADRIGTTALVAGVATLILPYIALRFVGPHPSGSMYGPIVALFPYAAISLFLLEDPAPWIWVLMFGQFPCYAIIVGRGWIKYGLLPASLFVLGIHIVSAIGAMIAMAFSTS